MAQSVGIVASITRPVIIEETGEPGLEGVAVGRVGKGRSMQVGGQLRLVTTWSRAQLKAAMQDAVRSAVADAYGLDAITGGAFVVLELL